jgi:ABC-type uncharacterized transport system permease subunit
MFLAPANAHAYLDPGTGGLLYQMAFALFSVVMGFLFVPFRAVKGFFLRMIGRSPKPADSIDPTDTK